MLDPGNSQGCTVPHHMKTSTMYETWPQTSIYFPCIPPVECSRVVPSKLKVLRRTRWLCWQKISKLGEITRERIHFSAFSTIVLTVTPKTRTKATVRGAFFCCCFKKPPFSLVHRGITAFWRRIHFLTVKSHQRLRVKTLHKLCIFKRKRIRVDGVVNGIQ